MPARGEFQDACVGDQDGHGSPDESPPNGGTKWVASVAPTLKHWNSRLSYLLRCHPLPGTAMVTGWHRKGPRRRSANVRESDLAGAFLRGPLRDGRRPIAHIMRLATFRA